MKKTRTHFVVLVTVPNLKAGRKLARAVLEARVAACANIVPRVESHYWWKGKLESGRELLLVLKTHRDRLAELEKVVRANHPYETPEFVAMPLSAGSEGYLGWIDESLNSGCRADAE